MLVAGAGFGKTLALQEALGDRQGPVAHVRCEPGDREGRPLVASALRTVDRALPGAVGGLGDRLVGVPPDEAARLLAKSLRWPSSIRW